MMRYDIVEVCKITKPIYEVDCIPERRALSLGVPQRPVEVEMWISVGGSLFKTTQSFTEIEWEEINERGCYFK